MTIKDGFIILRLKYNLLSSFFPTQGFCVFPIVPLSFCKTQKYMSTDPRPQATPSATPHCFENTILCTGALSNRRP